MDKRTVFCVITIMLSTWVSFAQVDTTGIYGERKDSLDATVYTGRRVGNYLARGKDLRTEVISAEGLLKMACCKVAESFVNSASVTVR